MKLRITAPHSDGRHFMSGAMASIFLDDVDVSRYVNRVVLTVDADGPISAEVNFYLTDVELDVPAVIEPMFREAREQGAEITMPPPAFKIGMAPVS